MKLLARALGIAEREREKEVFYGVKGFQLTISLKRHFPFFSHFFLSQIVQQMFYVMFFFLFVILDYASFF